LIQLLLLVIILVLVFLGIRRFLAASQSAAQSIQRNLVWGVLILLAFLAATGRLGIIIPIIGALVAAVVRLLPVLLQFFPLLHRLWRQHASQPAAGPSGSNRSTVESKYLRMHLDHTTGEISGLVVAGRFAGRDLQSMTLDELVHFYQHCAQDDQDSAVLLEAYLDRVHGQTWRQGTQQSDSSSRRGHNGMTAAEAYEVLGLAPGASREAIIEAHRRLMQKVHPDRGGSDFLAANVNRAKEVLLGR
jgi:hypothetical protein